MKPITSEPAPSMRGIVCAYLCLWVSAYAHISNVSVQCIACWPNISKGISAIYTQMHIRHLLMTVKRSWLPGPETVKQLRWSNKQLSRSHRDSISFISVSTGSTLPPKSLLCKNSQWGVPMGLCAGQNIAAIDLWGPPKLNLQQEGEVILVGICYDKRTPI